MAKKSKLAKAYKKLQAAKTKKAKQPKVKLQSGQNAPQSKRYTIAADSSVGAKGIGWRFTDEGAKRLGKSVTTRPTSAEVTKYKNKTFKVRGSSNPMSEDGSYRYVYNEKRADKTDKSSKAKLAEGGLAGDNPTMGAGSYAKGGQAAPQRKSYTKRGDKQVKAKAVGTRFTDKLAKRLGKNAYTKPTKAEAEKYRGRGVYSENRKDKSDVSPKNKLAYGGEVSSFEMKVKNAMKEPNKWHFITDNVNGKEVNLKMYVGTKEVDVQRFQIGNIHAKMPRNYVGKRETLKMIMDNFSNEYADGGEMAKGGQASPQSQSYSPRRDKTEKAKPVGRRFTDKLAKRLGRNPYTKPTAAEIEKYSGRGVYSENRKDKSDLSPKNKFAHGGQLELLVDSHYGIYVPQTFIQRYDLKDFGFNAEEIKEYKNVLSNVDHEDYWEVWDEIQSNAITKDGETITTADGDVWLVPKGYEYDDFFADGGEMAKGGQAPPQSANYSARRDKDEKAKPVGYRFTDKLAKRINRNPYSKPTKTEIEKYRGRGIAFETRKDKSDVRPLDKFRDGGYYARGGVERIANIQARTYTENHLPFKGNNLEGKVLDNGDYVVLSYGYYPIWFWSKRDNKWYGNKDKYSVTTGKHISQSRPSMNAEILGKGELDLVMAKSSAHYTAMANGGSLDLIIGDASNNPQFDITSPTFQGS